MLYSFLRFASGSSFFTARKAVGAVKNVFTLCSEITRQNAQHLEYGQVYPHKQWWYSHEVKVRKQYRMSDHPPTSEPAQ
ncbi:MAG: hypothetical protein Ct9H300mP28_28010 [Pseudomonadota bacterium]|nr:MAG: hypothetical protein Ct9H300mP28_28010 [Pseudomonadota bacterium]